MMSELPFDSFSKLDNYPFTQLLIYLHLKHNFQECFSFSAAIDPFDLRAQKTDLPLLSFQRVQVNKKSTQSSEIGLTLAKNIKNALIYWNVYCYRENSSSFSLKRILLAHQVYYMQKKQQQKILPISGFGVNKRQPIKQIQ